MIIKAIRYAFFRAGVTSPIGLGEDTRALFELVTEFMLVSIYVIIHQILLIWSNSPIGRNRVGGAKYRPIEPSDINMIFRKKTLI